jgi:hypothetical protein
MKTRTIAALTVTLLFASLFTMALSPLAKAHTESDPFVTDLIAGQTMDVGDVKVWNDGEYLFVQYVTSGGWTLGETHLHVATTLAAIPHTSKGNPVPGQFMYSMDHDPQVTEYTYAIDLNGWEPGDDLFIAAHAGVCGPGEGEPVAAQGVLAVVPLYTWSDAINVGTVTASIVGDNLVVSFDITFAGWVILDTHLYVGFTAPSYPPPYALFPYKHEGLGGVTTDSYTISLASLGAGCDDVLYISAHAYVSYPSLFVYRDAWSELDPSNGWEKYFSVTIPCQLVCETAWGEGTRFVSTTWAMYFTYTVQ